MIARTPSRRKADARCALRRTYEEEHSLNILYYYWGENSRDDMANALMSAGHNVIMTTEALADYNDGGLCEKVLGTYLDNNDIDWIFTFNYIPAISEFAHNHYLTYVSWVYDCPHLTLYSDTIAHDENYLFIFDSGLVELARANGGKHVFHLPLAVDAKRYDSQCLGLTDGTYQVSFLGSLYRPCQYDKINYLPDRLKGYLDGIMLAQQKVWGYHLTDELITDEISAELEKYVNLDIPDNYSLTPRDIFVGFIDKKITAMDRCALLSSIASHHSLALFTESDVSGLPLPASLGTLNYVSQMPQMFRQSSINLNISLRSITSGIPLRAMDILGAGGFLLSNYQPELEQFFTCGEHYVYFEDEKDMCEKIDYYLSHDSERRRIARNGHYRVSELFSYENAVETIVRTVLA
jgi:glycosyltransferase involved in cell wall biosynthesis